MTRNFAIRSSLLLVAGSFAAAGGLAVAQDAPSADTLEVAGVDLTTDSEIPVPVAVIEKAQHVYGIHNKAFRRPPRIDTRVGGHPNAFYVKRAKHSPAAASAGNLLPFNELNEKSPAGQRNICLGRTAYAQGGARENWCRGDGYSFRMFADAISQWNADLLISHELIHLWQYEKIPGSKHEDAPFWLVDGQANGIGYGLMEREKGFSRKAIALKTKDLENGNFSFFLGLRRYDAPLVIDQNYPIDHPEYYREVSDPGGYREYAGYMTGSFWRYVMRGRPQGFTAYKQMLERPGPADPGKADAWLKWTDAGLKAATYGKRGAKIPIWRGGVRQVFSEMITELADFPDIVAKNRTGKLAAPYFDSLLWTGSCKKVDLTQATAGSLRLKVQPYAAQCMRVKMPLGAPSGGGKDTLPSPFSVAVSGNGACADLELGTRGQLLTEPKSFSSETVVNGVNCVLVWNAGFAPLRPDDPNGLRGWQTIVLINAPTDPDRRKAHDVLVNIVRPVAVSTLTGTHSVPMKNSPKKQQKPLPKLKAAPEIQLVEPMLLAPEEETEACDADNAAIFACGDTMGLAVVSGDASSVMRAAETLNGGLIMQYPQGSLTNYGYKTLGELYQDSGEYEKKANSYLTNALQGTNSGATISFKMKRLAEGATGTFPARIEVEAQDASALASADALKSLSPKRTMVNGNGCVEVLSFQTNGTVNITVNTPGLLMGSLSATLYEENSDEEAACRQPMVAVGTVQVSFSTPGMFPIGPGSRFQLEYDRPEFQRLVLQDMIGQMDTPLSERWDIPPDDEIDPALRGRLRAATAGGGAAGGASAMCSGAAISEADRNGFIRAIANGTGESDPRVLAQVQQGMQSFSTEMLATHICKWIAAGRPARFEMEDSQ